MISGSDTSSSFYRMTLIFYPSSTLTSEDVLAANSSSSYRLGSTVSFRELVSDFEPRVRKLAELVQPEDCFLWKIAHLPKLKTWANGSGRVVLLGDAAHPPLQYMAQGACIALEDAVTLREALKNSDRDIERAFRLYEKSRIPRTARVQYSARLMGRIYHASGAERLVRNSLWKGRKPEDYYQALNWLYGWNVQTCLD